MKTLKAAMMEAPKNEQQYRCGNNNIIESHYRVRPEWAKIRKKNP